MARGDATSVSALLADPPLASLRKAPVPARIGNVRVGTASWTDRTLIDSQTFYPPGVVSPANRLRYYARHFPVVEVDATFYALPQAHYADAWVERTPADFSFGVKAFAAMTQHAFVPARLPHDLRLALGDLRRERQVYARDLPGEVVDEIWRQFRAGITPLHDAGVLGYVLFQFPKWFPRTRTSLAYLEHCTERLAGYPLAVEFRQPSWLSDRSADATFTFLRQHHLIYVVVDEPQGTAASVPPLAAVTSEALAVVRFNGRNAAAWDRPGVSVHEKFGYLYGEDELRAWRPRIRALAAGAREVHVLMNNCHRHYAVQNAKDIAEILATA